MFSIVHFSSLFTFAKFLVLEYPLQCFSYGPPVTQACAQSIYNTGNHSCLPVGELAPPNLWIKFPDVLMDFNIRYIQNGK